MSGIPAPLWAKRFDHGLYTGTGRYNCDIILLEFDPQVGHEQRGRRPAFVVSNYTFNSFTKMVMACPITNTKRGFPLHLPLDKRTKTSGVVMCEQVKALDIMARKATFIEKAPQDISEEIVDIVMGFVEID